jgi:hypothetical protein
MGSKRMEIDKSVRAKLSPDSPFYEIVEDAYRVFSIRKPTELGVCVNCCMEPEVEEDFLRPDRDQLPLAYVRDWFFAAPATPMPKGPWEYLLPRVLEILACGEEAATVGIEVTLSRFPTGDPEMWTSEQFAVLQRFAAAFLDQQKTSTTDHLDDVLCMLGLAGFALEPLLARLDAWTDAELAGKLYHDWAYPCGGGSIWITAFWEAPLNTRVFEWYTSRALYERMEAFGLNDETPREISGKALDVADIIRSSADWAD